MTLSGSPFTAKDIAARFTGSGGLQASSEIIRRVPLVEGNQDIANLLAAAAIIEPYELGEVIITQGATDTDILFILAGSVIVAPNDRDDTVRCAPAHVGEMATIDPVRRSATVRAKEPTVVARVAEPDFSRIANAHPFVWL